MASLESLSGVTCGILWLILPVGFYFILNELLPSQKVKRSYTVLGESKTSEGENQVVVIDNQAKNDKVWLIFAILIIAVAAIAVAFFFYLTDNVLLDILYLR
mgnify:FL=1